MVTIVIMTTAAAARRIGSPALDEIRGRFGLSEDELAALFGVSRPAIAKWRQRGVPVERAADVDRVRELADYFGRRFIAVRIPQIVRTPGNGLGGETVLDVIAEGGVDRVYAYLESLFSYTAS
jgi:transcriptional regulator with XRE-family HTH domain